VRRAVLLLACLVVLAMSACGGDEDAIREAGQRELDAISLPESWQRVDQRFTAAGWRQSANRWHEVWRAETTMSEARQVFTAAVESSGWGEVGDRRWHKEGYWMSVFFDGVICEPGDCVRVAVTVVDVKPS
jgi:hypothetical protein